MNKDLLIGFIGQGYIGKNYADDYEERGYKIVRYDVEENKNNKDKIKDCDIVFVAVPTPTTPKGFDYSVIESVLPLVGKDKTAVIKSTIQIGTTKKLQAKNPDIIVMHSPEFLTEFSAPKDARNPDRNIIGITDADNKELHAKAAQVMSTLPKAPYELITDVNNAEMIKYGGNCWFYFKIVFMNILYDLAQQHGLDYDTIKEGMSHDVRIGATHLSVWHKSGGEAGGHQRGAGGHCFIKDFESFIEMLDKKDLEQHKEVCEHIRNLNIKYLKDSNKDLDILEGVYGK